jgi:hypothetical protein
MSAYILLDLITLTIFAIEHRLWSSSLCNYLHDPSSSLLVTNTFLSILLSKPAVYVPLSNPKPNQKVANIKRTKNGENFVQYTKETEMKKINTAPWNAKLVKSWILMAGAPSTQRNRYIYPSVRFSIRLSHKPFIYLTDAFTEWLNFLHRHIPTHTPSIRRRWK